MKLFYLVLSFLSMTQSLHFTYQENFTRSESLRTLVDHKFISDLKTKNLNNFKMTEKSKNNKIIEYSGRKYGYPYKAFYDIHHKNDEMFKIRYKNTFLTNDIHLEKLNDNIIFVKVDIRTYLPIPQPLLENIVHRKLEFLRN